MDDGDQRLPEVVVVTGMSGAGRSTAANALEDLGWFVVDNLPPALLPTLVDLAGHARGGLPGIVAVTDVRGGAFFADLRSALEQVEAVGIRPRVVFLEADDDTLVRRFESSRRPHPLQGSGRIVDGISRERALTADLRDHADLLIDTSELNVHQLRARIDRAFADARERPLQVTVMSFGYKYGLPPDADLVADCRFLPNPHWVPELRPRTGHDPEVAAYVLHGQPAAEDFLRRYQAALDVVLRGYEHEGKHYALLAVGCTGGKHRSVAISEELGRRLAEVGYDVRVEHRDVGRE